MYLLQHKNSRFSACTLCCRLEDMTQRIHANLLALQKLSRVIAAGPPVTALFSLPCPLWSRANACASRAARVAGLRVHCIHLSTHNIAVTGQQGVSQSSLSRVERLPVSQSSESDKPQHAQQRSHWAAKSIMMHGIEYISGLCATREQGFEPLRAASMCDQDTLSCSYPAL